MTLTGCGILLLVLLGVAAEAGLGVLPEALIGITGLLLLVGGLLLEYKARQGRKAPASE